MSQAAKSLGLGRQQLWLKVKQFEINVDEFKDTVVNKQLIAVPTNKKSTVSVNAGSILRRKMVEYAMQVLEENKWNRTDAAKELGVGVRTIRNLIHEAQALEIEVYPSTYRPGAE